MKRTIFAAVAALALTTSASAFDLTIRHAPTLYFTPGASASITHVPEPFTDAERQERDAKVARWEEHCHPVRNVGEYGVIHLSYKHPGCEFGEGE